MTPSDADSSNSKEYQRKKDFFDRLLTIYGRKPVLEALQDRSLTLYKIHLADSNKRAGIVNEIIEQAEQRDITIQWHDRKALSRISRNSKQDQGVAADIQVDQHLMLSEYLQQHSTDDPNNNINNRPLRLLALCDIHNPQNMGMIIRSACAGDIDGIIIPQKGCAPLSALVIKASAGTVFKAPIIKCQTLKDALPQLKNLGFSVCALSSHAKESLFEHLSKEPIVYVLGNESEGVSADVFKLADKKLMIPMSNAVESLNVAVTAALIAFNKHL